MRPARTSTMPAHSPSPKRFGYREFDRQIEQVRVVGAEPPAAVPEGIEIVSVADRPELWREAYDPLALQAFDDMALDRPLLAIPRAMGARLALLAGGHVPRTRRRRDRRLRGLERDIDVPERAENALTAVLRGRRGRGIASSLKRTALAFAAANGIREIYTWTQQGNAGMRRLNEHLGYVERAVSISVRAPLPLSHALTARLRRPARAGRRGALSARDRGCGRRDHLPAAHCSTSGGPGTRVAFASRRRDDIVFSMLTARWGLSWSRRSTVFLSTSSTRASPTARTVAERVSFSKIAISPKNSPALSVPSWCSSPSAPVFTTSTLPVWTTYMLSPLAPSETITSLFTYCCPTWMLCSEP